MFVFTSLISYVNFNEIIFSFFSNTIIFFDDFYEAINDIFISELTGIYTSLYWSNSLLLIIIGVLLLIASIICVVLVSFFTKLRNYNYNTFLEFFSIVKSCYSFIFVRKQNLSKQGRGNTSTRIFNKKNFNPQLHSEYKEKQDIFEIKEKTKQNN